MWNDEITLIKRIENGYDELKQPVFDERETKILCKVRSTTRAEFYQAQAAQADLRPSKVVTVHTYEYQDEEFAIFLGKRYKVTRTYEVDVNEMELTLEEVL
ncbi:phage head closure protein [Streptococcus constellatus]|jgi:SPP1 family predicted phage head-tail adaptor|uniref:phage head closure protein n=1 Tax=Streptococcus constellatus TaxID=76860 RepID=UPI002001542E|nr:phage head closure protein [Streptococcus constellatus]